jgi:hypothetical protein
VFVDLRSRDRRAVFLGVAMGEGTTVKVQVQAQVKDRASLNLSLNLNAPWNAGFERAMNDR